MIFGEEKLGPLYDLMYNHNPTFEVLFTFAEDDISCQIT